MVVKLSKTKTYHSGKTHCRATGMRKCPLLIASSKAKAELDPPVAASPCIGDSSTDWPRCAIHFFLQPNQQFSYLPLHSYNLKPICSHSNLLQQIFHLATSIINRISYFIYCTQFYVCHRYLNLNWTAVSTHAQFEGIEATGGSSSNSCFHQASCNSKWFWLMPVLITFCPRSLIYQSNLIVRMSKQPFLSAYRSFLDTSRFRNR